MGDGADREELVIGGSPPESIPSADRLDPRPPRRSVVLVVAGVLFAGVVGAGLLVAQLFLRWIEDGNGSIFDGRSLAGYLIHSRVRPSWGPVGGSLMLLCGILGGALIAASLARSRIVAAVQMVVGASVVLSLGTLAVTKVFVLHRWGLGTRVLFVGGLVLTTSGIVRWAAHEWIRQVHHGTGRRILAMAAGGLAAAGGVALLLSSSAGVEAGERTSELAVKRLVESLNRSDLLGATAVMSPTEVDGVAPLLKRLEAAVQSSPALDGASLKLGLEVSLRRLSTRRLAAGVEEVSSKVEVVVTSDGAKDSVVDPLASLEPLVFDDFRFITVFERGGWFVSPLLTAGNFLVTAADLPAGDFDAVRNSTLGARTRPGDAQGAVDALTEGLSVADPWEMATGVDPGFGRLLDVYGDAAQEWLDSSDALGGLTLTADVSSNKEESAVLSDLVGTYDDGSTQFRLGSDCDVDSEESWCPLAQLPLTSPLTLSDLPVLLASHGSRVSIEVVPTLISWVETVVPRIDPSVLAIALRTEHLLRPVPLALGVPITSELGEGVLFRSYKVDTTPFEPLLLDVTDAERVMAWVFEDRDGTWTGLTRLSSTPYLTEGLEARQVFVPQEDSVVIMVVNDCDGSSLLFCSLAAPTAPHVSVTALPSTKVTPDAVVSPELEPREAALVTFVASESGRYKFSGNSAGLRVYRYESNADGSSSLEEVTLNSTEGETFANGSEVTLLMFNASAQAGKFDLEIKSNPYPRGFWRSGVIVQSITVDISQGQNSVSLFFQPGDQVAIVAVPNEDQDIWLDASCDRCDYTDSRLSGESEEISFSQSGDSSISVTVGGYSYYNDYGQVTIYAYFN